MRIILNTKTVLAMKNQIAAAALVLCTLQAFAAAGEYTLTIKDHAFSPKELKLPAGQKLKLLVVNQDPTPAEFESKPLGREKIIPGNSTAIINLGPLKPGRYAFVEEYHETEAAAQGSIVVE
jgi:hypothetical protein